MAVDTKVTSKMCPKMLKDLVYVITDEDNQSKQTIGNFEKVMLPKLCLKLPNSAFLQVHGHSLRKKHSCLVRKVKNCQHRHIKPKEETVNSLKFSRKIIPPKKKNQILFKKKSSKKSENIYERKRRIVTIPNLLTKLSQIQIANSNSLDCVLSHKAELYTIKCILSEDIANRKTQELILDKNLQTLKNKDETIKKLQVDKKNLENFINRLNLTNIKEPEKITNRNDKNKSNYLEEENIIENILEAYKKNMISLKNKLCDSEKKNGKVEIDNILNQIDANVKGFASYAYGMEQKTRNTILDNNCDAKDSKNIYKKVFALKKFTRFRKINIVKHLPQIIRLMLLAKLKTKIQVMF
ncbi:MAG: hypothetical protein MHPSP_000176 [Paramarteilia canceri]